MVVLLRITYKDPQKKGRSIPVASQRMFEGYWLPASLEIGLELIPLFETGYPILKLTEKTIPNVIDELNRLNTFFASRANTQVEIPEDVIRRVQTVTSELEYIQEHPGEIDRIRV